MSVLYGILAALATYCWLCTLAPYSITDPRENERLGAALVCAAAIGVIVGCAS